MSTITYEKLIKMLAENYEKVEESIASQILLKVSNHYPTVGSYRENVWKELFENIIPKKYRIEKGVFIIDSYGNKSNEVDLAIFDEKYTPYIFNYGEIKFIPIEAVAAVVQCKSNKIKTENITNWTKSIKELITSMDSVARIATKMINNDVIVKDSSTQTATRPILILCAMAPMKRLLKFKEHFDIILSVSDEKLHKYIRGEELSLWEWNDSLNHSFENMEGIEAAKEKHRDKMAIRIKEKPEGHREKLLNDLKVEQIDSGGARSENVLLSLIFQLNQLLMVINNPMLFPHRAYARCFNEILTNPKNEGDTDGKQK